MSRAGTIPKEELSKKVDQLVSIPCVAAILQPLVSYLRTPSEHQDMQRIIDLVSHDNSLTAQCLHMANSPLFSRWQAVTTTRAAVFALGLQRMRDIVLSCCVLKMMPPGRTDQNPTVFWEHSLACALVARKMAKRIGVRDPEQMYLAGLLHDLGFIVNLQIAPELFGQAVKTVRDEQRNLEEDVENELLGFNHCDSGLLLAERWELLAPIRAVIQHHHRPSQASEHLPMIALVSLCDQICRRRGLGYGYAEVLTSEFETDALLRAVRQEWPVAQTMNWAQVNGELDNYLKDVRSLVSVLFRLP